MSTEWVEKDVNIDLNDAITKSPSYEVVQELINKYPKNYPSGSDRSVFSLSFVASPDVKISNENGLVGFIKIGDIFRISEFLKSNTQAPVGPDGQQPLTAEDVQQEDNVSKLLKLVFPNSGSQCQRQLGISDVILPVFVNDELTNQDFPARHTTDQLVFDCIKYQAEQFKIKSGKTQEEMAKMSARMCEGAEERLANGISFRSVKDTIREYGDEGIKKKLAGILATAFTASAQTNFHICQAGKFMDSIDECKDEFEKYSKIIPNIAKKVKEVYLANHYIYETLRQAVENSIKNQESGVNEELKDFFEEAKALNSINIHWTDKKHDAVNAAIKSLFFHKMFDLYDLKILPFEGIFKHLEELHHLVKEKSPFTATEAKAEAAAKTQILETNKFVKYSDFDEEMT